MLLNSILSLCALRLQALNQAGVMNDTVTETELKFQSVAKILLCVLPCLLFLYVNAVMMFALLRKPFLRECPRYILFGHLLLTDSLQLLLAMLFYIFAINSVTMTSYLCIFLTLLASTCVKISPLILAAMSSERYVAICFPLRHADIVTVRMTGVAIAVIWTMGSFDSCTQLFLFISLENWSFAVPICSRDRVFKMQIFAYVSTAITIVNFVLVSVIIIYTYIAIMITVKSASSGARNAVKAHKTVLLHLIQLCMCLISTLFHEMNSSNIWSINPSLAIHIQYTLFIGFIVFPKCLSPLIYGLRDQTFRQVFKCYFTFGLKINVKPCPRS